MKKSFLVPVLCFLFVMMGSAVFASSVQIDTSKLTDEQKASIAVQIAEMQKKSVEPPTVEKVNQWVDVGKNVGVALAATAKEIGVAADQFLQSNTGKITVALIIWKVIGKDLVGFIVGLGMLVFLIPLWVYFFRRMCIIKEITIEYPKDKVFGKSKNISYRDEGDCDGTRFVMLIVLALIIIASLVVIF